MSHIRQIAVGPAVRPGEIWLVEQPADADITPLDHDAIASANVILYDRALEALVAEILPLGKYAEPLPAGGPGAGPAISARAMRFAEDGWRVVQIVEARPGWSQQVQNAHASLGTPRRSGDTLIFGPLAERAPVPGQAFTANGLAG
jgi:hypothetical protein